jgi:DNA-binding response OmpR family regulator
MAFALSSSSFIIFLNTPTQDMFAIYTKRDLLLLVTEMSMAQTQKVLVVDDDRTWQVFLFAALQDSFVLKSAYDGEQGLQIAREVIPDCILLDINMPGRNGYEICKELKSDPITNNIPVIFLSSKTSLQEKIQGFEMGAEDYLVKSAEADLLKAKISRAIQQYHEKQAMDEKVSAAQTAAFEALSGSADLGRCLRFVERTYSMSSFETLAAGLFQTMGEFGLRSSLMFITSSGPIFFSQGSQDISPLEKEMFLASHKQGRFCDYGYRTFCNFKLVSMLIKNMPLDQPERYGRIKDTIPWVLGATDGKVRALNEQNALISEIESTQMTTENLKYQFSTAVLNLEKTQPELAKSMEVVYESIEKIKAQHKVIADKARAVASDGDNKTELGENEIFSSDVDLF